MNSVLFEVIELWDIRKAEGKLLGFGLHSPAWDSRWKQAEKETQKILGKIK